MMERLAYFLLLLTFFRLAKSTQPSMYSPPWKHCINNMHAKWSWQEVASPGFPYGIDRQTHCSWILLATPPNRIKLAFYVLNMTGSVNNCFSQYVEFWDIPTAKSVGKFCGTTRPGDFVSPSGAVRVDLKADWANTPHSGFLLKFKLSKENPGYKKSYEFSKNSLKSLEVGNQPVRSTLPPLKPRTIQKGGKINLNAIKRRRRPGERKVNRVTAVRPPPIRNYSPPLKNELIVVSDDQPASFQLWIIILISVGGFLFIVLIAVICWICFCRRRNTNQKGDLSNFERCDEYFPPQKSLFLPSAIPNFYLPYYPKVKNQSQVNHSQKDFSLNQEAVTSPQKKRSSKKRRAPPVPNSGRSPTKLTPINRKTVNSSTNIEQSPTKTIKKQQKKKSKNGSSTSVPTLKRKLSPWEKEQIRNGKLKTYNI